MLKITILSPRVSCTPDTSCHSTAGNIFSPKVCCNTLELKKWSETGVTLDTYGRSGQFRVKMKISIEISLRDRPKPMFYEILHVVSVVNTSFFV